MKLHPKLTGVLGLGLSIAVLYILAGAAVGWGTAALAFGLASILCAIIVFSCLQLFDD